MIHGGSYRAGSSDSYFFGPDFIVEKQTILVTINYRLGMLGFLSLNSTEYSGNMGLKDQQLAMKWIHSNIDRFGGDSKRITIIGQSAGKRIASWCCVASFLTSIFSFIRQCMCAFSHAIDRIAEIFSQRDRNEWNGAKLMDNVNRSESLGFGLCAGRNNE